MNALLRRTLLLLLFTSLVSAADVPLGSVGGFVKFPGETPPRNMFANPADHDCPHGIAQNHLLVKQTTRGLANALVILERTDVRVMPTRISIPLTTVGCQLTPRIQWVPQGTSLLLTSKDPAEHHLQALRKSYTLFDVRISPEQPLQRRPMVVAGMFKVNCQKHPWERAWVYVSPHDSVAITDADGRFLIKNVPPGKYHITARHEGWDLDTTAGGTRLEYIPMIDERHIVVRKNQTTEVLFDTLVGQLEFDPQPPSN